MLNKMLKLADTIAIGGHIRPDGDCIGSCMGLGRYIKENYSDKTVEVYLEEIPEKFRFWGTMRKRTAGSCSRK